MGAPPLWADRTRFCGSGCKAQRDNAVPGALWREFRQIPFRKYGPTCPPPHILLAHRACEKAFASPARRCVIPLAPRKGTQRLAWQRNGLQSGRAPPLLCSASALLGQRVTRWAAGHGYDSTIKPRSENAAAGCCVGGCSPLACRPSQATLQLLLPARLGQCCWN
jgi:hypothetical protein